MLRSRFGVVLVPAILMAGCDSPASMDARPYEDVIAVDRNYQAVYAGMLSTMRTCTHPGTSFFPSPGETTLDAQLYSELGYGEIRNGISGVIPQTYGVARIERSAGGTIVRIKSGRGLGEPDPAYAAWLRYWAKGGAACPKFGAAAPPS